MEPFTKGFIRIYPPGEIEEWANPPLERTCDSEGKLEE
jgi:hypothetical protein